jgi:hypothetical protein
MLESLDTDMDKLAYWVGGNDNWAVEDDCFIGGTLLFIEPTYETIRA